MGKRPDRQFPQPATLVRIDALLAFGLLLNFSYGYFYAQWLGALQACAGYILVVTCVWFFF